MFNQFHDILPGTSITEVFTEANQDWESAIAIGRSLLNKALDTIASNIELPLAPQADAIPIVVFNSLNWTRSQVVTIEDESFSNCNVGWQIYNDKEVEVVANCHQQGILTFMAKDIPGVGYRLFWLCPQPAIDTEKNIASDRWLELSNQHFENSC